MCIYIYTHTYIYIYIYVYVACLRARNAAWQGREPQSDSYGNKTNRSESSRQEAARTVTVQIAAAIDVAHGINCKLDDSECHVMIHGNRKISK